MKLISIIAAATVLIGASSAVIQKSSEVPDVSHLPITPMMWKGQIFPDGPEVELNGTAASILAEIKKLNPDWQTHGVPEHTNATHLGKRSNRVGYQCNVNRWGAASIGAIGVGCDSIRSFPGYCYVGPHACSRFSCSYNSAIIMCNDADTTASIPCATLAQNANFLTWVCRDEEAWQANGQAFYENPSYNVLVKHTDPGKGC